MENSSAVENEVRPKNRSIIGEIFNSMREAGSKSQKIKGPKRVSRNRKTSQSHRNIRNPQDMVSQLQHLDHDLDILPYGYERRYDPKVKRYFYMDHFLETTSWERPSKLPANWERRLFQDENGTKQISKGGRANTESDMHSSVPIVFPAYFYHPLNFLKIH